VCLHFHSPSPESLLILSFFECSKHSPPARMKAQRAPRCQRSLIIPLLLLSDILISIYPIRFTYSTYFFCVYFHFIASSSEPRDPPIDTATANPLAFVSHMSTFPLMGCVYEQGKASSRVIKSIFLILILLHVTLFPLISMVQQWSSRVSKSYPALSSTVSL